MKKILPTLVLALAGQHAALPAAEWTYHWKAAPNGAAPTATVCPLLYDKAWAYSIEIDDSPVFPSTFAAAFFAQYHFTDAPPGIPGGKALPVVGSVAMMVQSVGANSSYLTWDQTRDLLARGWGVANHSFYHAGRTYGDPPEILTAEQIKEDLFWSQALLAERTGLHRAPTHFVYPNGYMGYHDFLAGFGMRSATRVGGKSGRNLDSAKDLLDLSRNYLDEGTWTNKWNNSDPMTGIPTGGEVPNGELIIDFTHKMEAAPESPNLQRWKTRLDTLAAQYGEKGSDRFWSAPVETVVNYKLAARKAVVSARADGLTVRLPDDVSGSALTVRLEGIPASVALQAPAGGALYRRGSVVWLTTPVIGLPGAPAPTPAVKCVFRGAVGDYAFPTPAKLAAVLVRQAGAPKVATECQVNFTPADGGAPEPLPPIPLPARSSYRTMIFSAVPNRPAPTVRQVHVTPEATLQEMEVWTVAE